VDRSPGCRRSAVFCSWFSLRLLFFQVSDDMIKRQRYPGKEADVRARANLVLGARSA
jgi:hypothetical protein